MIKIVSKNVAKNPVARAVAKVKLKEAIRSQKIWLYMTGKGEKCRDMMDGLYLTLSVIGYAFEWQNIKKPEEERSPPDIRVLRGGMSACKTMGDLDYFDPINVTAIDLALDAAERLNQQVSADSIHHAWTRLK